MLAALWALQTIFSAVKQGQAPAAAVHMQQQQEAPLATSTAATTDAWPLQNPPGKVSV
jgi:hypothetical protein